MEKRYYWLKLSDDFFNDKAIKKLRKIAGGDTYTVIYLKMLLKAIKQENRLYFEGVEENFAAELALELNEDEENVAVTIQYLRSKGLLKVMSEEEFLLTQCDEMVGSETDAARRQRKSRIRKKQDEKDHEGKLLMEPLKKETQIQLFERLAVEYNLTENLKDKLRDWLKYKTERKESYKEQGMKSLLRQIESRAANYGDDAVGNLIDECMASNWKGIIWDKLEKGIQKDGRIKNRMAEVDSW